MKNLLIIFPLLLLACTNENKDFKSDIQEDQKNENSSQINQKYLKDILSDKYHYIEFFDSTCLVKLERGFKYSQVWKENYYLWEGCTFVPKNELVVSAPSDLKDYIFLAYFVEKEKDSFYYEIYARNNKFDSYLKPIHLVEGEFVFDSIYHVSLYLEGGVKCGNLFMEGTDYSDTTKLGVYQEINDPKISRYVDSMIQVRDSINR